MGLFVSSGADYKALSMHINSVETGRPDGSAQQCKQLQYWLLRFWSKITLFWSKITQMQIEKAVGAY